MEICEWKKNLKQIYESHISCKIRPNYEKLSLQNAIKIIMKWGASERKRRKKSAINIPNEIQSYNISHKIKWIMNKDAKKTWREKKNHTN